MTQTSGKVKTLHKRKQKRVYETGSYDTSDAVRDGYECFIEQPLRRQETSDD